MSGLLVGSFLVEGRFGGTLFCGANNGGITRRLKSVVSAVVHLTRTVESVKGNLAAWEIVLASPTELQPELVRTALIEVGASFNHAVARTPPVNNRHCWWISWSELAVLV